MKNLGKRGRVEAPIRPLVLRDPGSPPVEGGLDSPKPLNGNGRETMTVQPQIMFSSDITFRHGDLPIVKVK